MNDSIVIDYDNFKFTIINNKTSIDIKVLNKISNMCYYTSKTDFNNNLPNLEIFCKILINSLLNKNNCSIIVNLGYDKLHCWVNSINPHYETQLVLNKIYDFDVIKDFEEKIEQLKLYNSKLKNDIAQLQLNNFNNTQIELINSITQSNNLISQLKKKNTQLEEKNNQFTLDTKRLRLKNTQLEEKVEQLTLDTAIIHGEIAQLKKQINQFKKENEMVIPVPEIDYTFITSRF